MVYVKCMRGGEGCFEKERGWNDAGGFDVRKKQRLGVTSEMK